jgi:hypothetical protein
METNTIKNVLVIGIAVTLLSFDLPLGWYKSGSEPLSYEMGIEKGAGLDGKNAATIKSKEEKIAGFGTLMQQFIPYQFLGKRIRLTGYIKTDEVLGSAGFWLRVEQANSVQSLAIDNMKDRPIKGTNNWKKVEIVLEVPENASKISYGAYLKGTGQIWFDNLIFEEVSNFVPITGKMVDRKILNKYPLNLDFDY